MLERVLETLPVFSVDFVAPEQEGSQRNVGQGFQAAVAAEIVGSHRAALARIRQRLGDLPEVEVVDRRMHVAIVQTQHRVCLAHKSHGASERSAGGLQIARINLTNHLAARQHSVRDAVGLSVGRSVQFRRVGVIQGILIVFVCGKQRPNVQGVARKPFAPVFPSVHPFTLRAGAIEMSAGRGHVSHLQQQIGLGDLQPRKQRQLGLGNQVQQISEVSDPAEKNELPPSRRFDQMSCPL